MELNERILFMAFRYALGRRTYVVSEVADTIVKQWPELPQHYRELVHKEIREAIDRDMAGDDCDVEQWKRVLNLPVNNKIESNE